MFTLCAAVVRLERFQPSAADNAIVSQFESFWMIGRRTVFTVSTSAPRMERVWVRAWRVARFPVTKPSAAPAADRTNAKLPASILSRPA